MKLCSFRHLEKDGYGAIVNNEVVDLSAVLREPNLRAALEHVPLPKLREEVARLRPAFPLQAVQLLPVIPEPEKILCVGINYASHAAETGRAESSHPTLFTRFTNTLVGHNQPLVAPRSSQEFDYEAELAVVIGKRARHVTREDALDCVAGYTCFNDGSVRDWQRHSSQFTAGKNFVKTAALGPWLVTRDELPDPSALQLSLRLNGTELQKASTKELIFDVPALLAYITTFTELVPGDIIATGTPSGVGSKRQPPIFMKDGDRVEVELSGVGVLRNPVVAEP